MSPRAATYPRLKELSWNPRRRGLVYCAPACGRGCTRAEYEDAVARGKALAKRLGPGWTHEVWENLGWYTKAVSPCGRWKVHDDGRGASRYTAFLGDAGSAGGIWAESGSTALEAIRATWAAARQSIDYYTSFNDARPTLFTKGIRP